WSAGRRVRRPRRAQLRLGRRVARRPQGDRHGRARLGVDGVRLGRGPALQLRRRCAEHVPGLERDAPRRARRLRARVLPRLPDRPRVVHRGVLRQPRLGRRERLGRAVRHPELGLVLLTAVFVAAGYLSGSLTWGYWLVRIFRGEDVRKKGSGNVGATNVWRVYGPKLGLPAAFLDTAKGFAPAFAATLVVGHGSGVLAGAAAMLGHWRPLYLGFSRGGKMVATAGGAFLGVAPLVGVTGAGVWLLVFGLTRYASVASMTAAASLPLWAWLFGYPWPVIAFGAAAGVGVVVLHRANLGRLWRVEENRSTLWRRWRKPTSAASP